MSDASIGKDKKHRRFDSDGSPVVPILRKDDPDARGLISGDHDIYPKRHKFSPSSTVTRSHPGSKAVSARSPSLSASTRSSTVTSIPGTAEPSEASASERRYSSSPEKVEPGEQQDDSATLLGSGVGAAASTSKKPLTPEQQHKIITRYYYTKTTNWSKYKSGIDDRERKDTMEEIEARAQFQESTAAHLMELANTMAEATEETRQAMEELLGEGVHALGIPAPEGEEEEEEGEDEED